MNTLSDHTTMDAKVERARYARICVELDLQKSLVPRVVAAGEVFNVEYEGLKLICFECGKYGHRKEVCPWKKNAQQENMGDTSVRQKEIQPERVPEKKPEFIVRSFWPVDVCI
ncbi:hypothetical protein QN277_000720 [Acacia crassicarpa]|uniref:CCHC-type domain-containing protein n=1 Tax=Acacia crassicarpa TaxID=499986 RepID=A0AAE1N5M6_9FABA|nr:hypothetical protein QN277_000720 [Acacia crassicarpa]